MEHDDVHDRVSFALFATQLRAEIDNPSLSANWENIDLASFLDAMAAWARDAEKPADSNPWRHAAGILAAAAVYE
ncbi:DUF7660 family protein [Sphingobium yanoikuyae]|uniref:DUF7660 family protein n=1 Tax=Sphingobium yanoikuyae TaxID=13690 RepID=UPI0026E96365|nr:hypothetical protein [Sphingobium yanoikuyae]